MTKRKASKLALVAPTNSVEGNTKTSTQDSEKRPSGSLRWQFTWNNFPENWMALLAPALERTNWICEVEIAPTTGTIHLQGYVEFPTKVRPIGYKGAPKDIHWGDKDGKPAKGTRADNTRYCSKDFRNKEEWATELFGNLKPEREKIDMSIDDESVMQYDELNDWGRELVDMVSGRLPDKTDRRIFVYWSKEGQMKKTETARHLCYYHDAVVIQGGRKHVLAVGYKNPAPIYILTVPRCDEGFVSYASIELLKDALYMSAFGTEATGMVNRKKPWVICIGNFDIGANCDDKMSTDRWVSKNVDQ
jgi:hypothetical protein